MPVYQVEQFGFSDGNGAFKEGTETVQSFGQNAGTYEGCNLISQLSSPNSPPPLTNGILLPKLNIPQGGTVTSAILTVRVIMAYANPDVTIFGDASPNALAYSAASLPEDRSKTTASVVTSFDSNPFDQDWFVGFVDFDVTSIVQERINDSSWQNNQHVGLIVDSTRRVVWQGVDTDFAPYLTISSPDIPEIYSVNDGLPISLGQTGVVMSTANTGSYNQLVFYRSPTFTGQLNVQFNANSIAFDSLLSDLPLFYDIQTYISNGQTNLDGPKTRFIPADGQRAVIVSDPDTSDQSVLFGSSPQTLDGDIIHYETKAVNSDAQISINSNGTFSVSGVTGSDTFSVRRWSSSVSLWGAASGDQGWQQITVNSAESQSSQTQTGSVETLSNNISYSLSDVDIYDVITKSIGVQTDPQPIISYIFDDAVIIFWDLPSAPLSGVQNPPAPILGYVIEDDQAPVVIDFGDVGSAVAATDRSGLPGGWVVMTPRNRFETGRYLPVQSIIRMQQSLASAGLIKSQFVLPEGCVITSLGAMAIKDDSGLFDYAIGLESLDGSVKSIFALSNRRQMPASPDFQYAPVSDGVLSQSYSASFTCSKAMRVTLTIYACGAAASYSLQIPITINGGI